MFRPTHDKIRAAYREGEEAKNGCQALDATAGCAYTAMSISAGDYVGYSYS